jgi:hypothetical protein
MFLVTFQGIIKTVFTNKMFMGVVFHKTTVCTLGPKCEMSVLLKLVTLARLIQLLFSTQKQTMV